MSKSEHFTFTIQADGLGFVSINRPPVNALSTALISELHDVLKSLKKEKKLRVLIISSKGKHFCAGADLKERSSMNKSEARSAVKNIQNCFNLISAIAVPTIAALNGSTLGGGAELALACDFRVAGESAIIGFPETSLGIIPGASGTQRLPRLIGITKAKYWILSARKFTAEEAWQDGVVDFISGDDEVLETAIDLAQEILHNAPISLKAAKSAIDKGMDVNLDAGLKIESNEYEKTLNSQDRIEALQAFAEKRAPKWSGK